MKTIGLVLLVILYNNCLYAMELRSSYVCGTTTINVEQKLFTIKDVEGKVTFICSGINEQQLIEQKIGSEYCVGDTHMYHRKSRIIEVVEPILTKSQYDGEYWYFIERHCLKDKNLSYGVKWYGDDAVEKACDDLALCYKNVLMVGLKAKLCDNQKRSIAFPEIGTCFDFSRERAALVAVPEIIKFIKNNPKAYSRIDLFVKEQSEVTLYGALLNFYLEEIDQKNWNFYGVNS